MRCVCAHTIVPHYTTLVAVVSVFLMDECVKHTNTYWISQRNRIITVEGNGIATASKRENETKRRTKPITTKTTTTVAVLVAEQKALAQCILHVKRKCDPCVYRDDAEKCKRNTANKITQHEQTVSCQRQREKEKEWKQVSERASPWINHETNKNAWSFIEIWIESNAKSDMTRLFMAWAWRGFGGEKEVKQDLIMMRFGRSKWCQQHNRLIAVQWNEQSRENSDAGIGGKKMTKSSQFNTSKAACT